MAISNHALIFLTFSLLSISMLLYMRKVNATSLNQIQIPAPVMTGGNIVSVGLNNFTSEIKKDEEELIFLKPFVSLISNVHLAIGYKVEGCAIAKAMSQLTLNLVCYLENAEAFDNTNLTFSDTWHKHRDVCAKIRKWYHKAEIESGKINLSEYVKFAFVRDPMDRFRSFYIDKCIREKACCGCKDVLCAAKTSYETLKKFMETGESEGESMYMASHAAPQTWYCEFGKTLHEYKIIQIGASIEERKSAFEKLAVILRKGNVPEIHIERIMKDALPAETVHSTHNRNESQDIMNEIENNPEVRKYIHHMYYYDYIAFGFNMTGLDESFRAK